MPNESPDLEAKVKKLEQKVAALETALHLSLVAVAPTTKWLDVTMAEIEASCPT